ncbi:MAG TPA: glycosyltransferase 87 family protein [Candidatus Acidoferrales bacterium]|nr:glycosyltransferase 87 family protein [Candidatus Acidoferrales bacterium]
MRARAAFLAVAYLAIAVAAFALRPVATPGPFLRDFEAYWSAGAAWNAHDDPYGPAIWNGERTVPGVDARRDEVLPFVGPPATAVAFSPLARLPYPAAAKLWYALLALALFALVAIALRAIGAPASAEYFAAGVALAIGFGPITSDLALGQLALPAFLGATVAAVVGRPALATIGAFAGWLQPNVALAMLSRFGRNRATLGIAAGSLLAYAVGAFVAGPRWPVAYLSLLRAHGGAERFSAIQFTPAAIAFGYGASPAAAIAAGLGVALAAVVAAIAIYRTTLDPFARFAACSALLPFVAGFFHEHDLLAAFPAAVYCARAARGRTRTVALAAVLFVAIDWLGLAQRPTGIAQSIALAIAAACAFAALAPRPELRGGVPAIAVAALVFAACAAAAAAHPQPVWPDALGAFRSPTPGVAATWLAEQRRTGLLNPQWVWALLRTLSLTGCAGLAWAAARAA